MQPTDQQQHSQKRKADVIDIRKSSGDKKPPNNFVDYLFNRFAFIWGVKWANKIADVEEGARTEWASAIDGLSRKQLDTGINTARNQLAWPPDIAEFLPLCKGESIVQANHFNCCVNGCPDAGSVCTTPFGSNWICIRHFREGKG